MARPQVVIVGAGFGGLAAARGLAAAPVDVTLVDRNNFHTFQPLLYQVATSGLASSDVAYPVRGIVARQDNLAFRQASVIGADLGAKRLHLHGDGHEVDDLAYDHLVLAAGATTNTFGIPGVEQHGFPLYGLADAVHLRNHVLERFEASEADPSLVAGGSLTFVVVGGGPTGVEVAGALVELFHLVLSKDFRGRLDVSKARVVLVEMQADLLSPFSEASRRHARETLEARGVEVRTGTQVARVRADRVAFEDGTEIAAHTLVWAAGVRANPIGAALGLATGQAGRIIVGPDLQVPDHPGVWAIGDIAAIADGRGRRETLLPQLAPVAIQSGRFVAAEIARAASATSASSALDPVRPADVPPPTFRYRDKGTMATIGRSRAVAELPFGIVLQGFPAWLSWLGLHLVMLAGFRNRISVFANWAWNWLTYDRGPRLIFRPRR